METWWGSRLKVTRTSDLLPLYDFVIVGAGSAGNGSPKSRVWAPSPSIQQPLSHPPTTMMFLICWRQPLQHVPYTARPHTTPPSRAAPTAPHHGTLVSSRDLSHIVTFTALCTAALHPLHPPCVRGLWWSCPPKARWWRLVSPKMKTSPCCCSRPVGLTAQWPMW